MSDPITDGIVSLFRVEDFQIVEGKFFEETLDWYFVEELNAYGIRGFLHYTSRKSAEIELEKVLLKINVPQSWCAPLRGSSCS